MTFWDDAFEGQAVETAARNDAAEAKLVDCHALRRAQAEAEGDEPEDCGLCDGSGDCCNCDGSGEDDDGDPCDSCDGTGACHHCDGSGKQ